MLAAAPLFQAAGWKPIDTDIVVVGILASMACAVLGVFLVLRRMSMMGDALSHAVLPGLAAAFLITADRTGVAMLLGAAIVGIGTALLTQLVHSYGRVEEGAAMGVVFTVLFALGLVLIVVAAHGTDLDPDCVLHGYIETVALDHVALPAALAPLLGPSIPRAALTTGTLLLVNLLFIGLLYKELKLCTFDAPLATALGFSSQLLHYLLMTLVAMTTVVAFEAVGSILVIAMLIVPAATARLLTDRLSVMLVLSMALGAAAALLGHAGAITLPSWLGFGDFSTSTSGMMGVAAGALFVVALFCAPRQGLLTRAWHQTRLTLRVAREDVIGRLYRLEENSPGTVVALRQLRGTVQSPSLILRLAVRGLRREGLVRLGDGQLLLTAAGQEAARELVRSHRLWETYLDQHVWGPADHGHDSAEQLEHVTDPALQRRLAASLGHPDTDPHGKSIPTQPNPP